MVGEVNFLKKHMFLINNQVSFFAPACGEFQQGTLGEKGRETETGDTKKEAKTNFVQGPLKLYFL